MAAVCADAQKQEQCRGQAGCATTQLRENAGLHGIGGWRGGKHWDLFKV